MIKLQRIASVTAFVQAAALAALLGFLVVLLPRVGIPPTDLYTPASVLPAMRSPLLPVFYALFFSFGVTLLILALAMRARLKSHAPVLSALWMVTAVMGAFGWTAYAVVGSTMVAAYPALAVQNPAAAEAMVAAGLGTLSQVILLGAYFGVTTTVLWGWAALRQGSLPRALCYLIIGASSLRYVTAAIPLPPLVLLQLGGSVVWGFWFGALLWREVRGMSHARTLSAALS